MVWQAAAGAPRRNRTEQNGGEGRTVWEALPKCKASPRRSSAGYFTGCLPVAHIHNTAPLQRPVIAAHHLPRLAIHSRPSGCGRRQSSSRACSSAGYKAWLSLLIDMRCRRRPRLAMGWLRSVLSPLRRLWCRINAVQRKSTSPMCNGSSHALFLLVF